MDELKNNNLTEQELTAEEKVEKGLPVDSSEEIIDKTAPAEAFAAHAPADVAPEERGRETEGPANLYNDLEEGMNALTGDKQPPKGPEIEGGFKEKIWRPYLWPIITLVVICLVVSLLLGVTNSITAPIIQQNADRAAEQTRAELLPAATGFEAIDVPDSYEGIVSMYRATNDVGYVVEAEAYGYGGEVPVMVAFDTDGIIVGIKFLDNDETPGLGQRVATSAGFSQQFLGKPGNMATNTVDKIASATVSSNAAFSAVDRAVAVFEGEVLGNIKVELTAEEVLQMLLPDAGTITELSVSIPNVDAAWAGDDGGYIITGVSTGIYGDPITAMVGIDAGGNVTGVWLDTHLETAGYGKELQDDEGFKAEFEGITDTAGVDAVAGATISSQAVINAVQNALDALEQVKGAA